VKREIKFRAWDSSKEEFTDYNTLCFTKDGFGYAKPLGYSNMRNPDDLELMQFTGYQDKNKKDIYDGDIVKVCEEYGGYAYIPLVVDFKDGCFVLRPINNLNSYSPMFQYDFDQIYEIIGNKYENSELMIF
jgi:uncharacterized phage protein (TIGR01671 family)